jgi:hypothetical protein
MSRRQAPGVHFLPIAVVWRLNVVRTPGFLIGFFVLGGGTFLDFDTAGITRMAFGHERDARMSRGWLRLVLGLSALGLFIAWGAWHAHQTPPPMQPE